MKILYRISFLIIVSIVQSCSQKTANLASVDIEPYFKNEGGKFITMCLSEPLEKRETIYVKFNFLSKTKRNYEYGCTFYGENEKCFKFNIYVYLAHRHSTKEDMDFLNNHLNKGNIKELNIEIFDKYEGNSLYKGFFKNL